MWYKQRVLESSKDVAEINDIKRLNDMSEKVREQQSAFYSRREGSYNPIHSYLFIPLLVFFYICLLFLLLFLFNSLFIYR